MALRTLALALVMVLTWPAGKAAASLADAVRFWQEGYVLHVMGRYEEAAERFRASIAEEPTAEAHTFLGWSLSHLGSLEEAIEECERAIALDPDFGNPYNDIGVYLIALERADEAIPWFEKAIAAERYCCYQFPHFNKGRVLLMQGEIEAARGAFRRALGHDPNYAPARAGLRYIEEEHGRPL